jgi:hypothetical protein
MACMTFMFVILLADARLRQMQRPFTHRHVNRTIEAARHVHLATEDREPDNQLNGISTRARSATIDSSVGTRQQHPVTVPALTM